MDLDVTSLSLHLVFLIEYRSWYLVMGRSLEGSVQVTLRAGLPELAALVRTGGPTCEGTEHKTSISKPPSVYYFLLEEIKIL